MNFTTVSNRNVKWCPIDPASRKTGLRDFATIRKNDIYISDTLYEKLQFPDFIQIAISDDGNTIGFKKTDENDPFSIKIKMTATGGGRTVSCTNVVDTIVNNMKNKPDMKNVNISCIRAYAANGYSCFDLDKAEIIQKKRRIE